MEHDLFCTDCGIRTSEHAETPSDNPTTKFPTICATLQADVVGQDLTTRVWEVTDDKGNVLLHVAEESEHNAVGFAYWVAQMVKECNARQGDLFARALTLEESTEPAN